MARHLGLTRRRGGRLLALGAAVLLAHGLAIDWLARHQVQTTILKPMVAPMYSRVLTPQAPASPPPAPPVRAAVRPPPSVRALPAVAAKPRKPASAPQADPPPPPTTAATREGAPDALAPAEAVAAAASAAEPVTEHATEPAVPPAPIDRWPGDTRLSYQLTGYFRGDLHGDARVLWQREGLRYQVRVEADVGLLARLVLTSQGEVGPDGLVPAVFEELRNGKSRGVRIGEREVVLANGDVLARPPGVQDTASQFVELSHRFASGREVLEIGRTVSFWMARPGAIDLWTYDVAGRETLHTARLGAIEAFHLKPRPLANPRGNITAEMWFAPSLQYLPVRIRVNMGSEAHIDLLVEAIEQR